MKRLRAKRTKATAQKESDLLAAEQQAFQRQRAQLLRRYPGQYVAFRGGKLAGHDRDDEALAEKMFARFGELPFYIARVEEEMSFFEVPSPELAS